MLQVVRLPKIYDGAAGGAAAKVLTGGGASVVIPRSLPQLPRQFC